MIARIRKAQEEREGGFTLIELLVVIIIIGILAAIAIPVFLNQRKKAVDTSEKSDLRTVANELETYFVDNQSTGYPAVASSATPVIGTTTVKLTAGNLATITVNANKSAYCISMARAAAAQPGTGTGVLVYESWNGGIQAAGVTCPSPVP